MADEIKSLDELLTDIPKLHITTFDSYARNNSEAIHLYFETDENDGKLYEALHEYAAKYASIEYDYIIARISGLEYAGQISRKDIFAYVLEKLKFSIEKRDKILYDIDESEDSIFGEHDTKELLPRLKYELLNPEKAIDYSDADVEHPAD